MRTEAFSHKTIRIVFTALSALILAAVMVIAGAMQTYAAPQDGDAGASVAGFEDNGRYKISFTPEETGSTVIYENLTVRVYDEDKNLLAEAFDGMADERSRWDTKDFILDFDGTKARSIEFSCYYSYRDSEGEWTGDLTDTIRFEEVSDVDIEGEPVSVAGDYAPAHIYMGKCSVSAAPYDIKHEPLYTHSGKRIGDFALSGIHDPTYGWAFPGETVTVTFVPTDQYRIRGILVDGSEQGISGSDGVYTFTMPKKDVTVESAGLAPVEYIDPTVSSGDKIKYCEDYEYLPDGSRFQEELTLPEGWYILPVTEKRLVFNSRIYLSGPVNIILSDGGEMLADEGIEVDFYATKGKETSLTIWGQSEGTGKLVGRGFRADGGEATKRAVIGGSENVYTGDITINGGTLDIDADPDGKRYQYGEMRPPAIGGGCGEYAGFRYITINGGDIYAHTDTGGPAIGAGQGCREFGTITINGGIVNASGGAAGIGGWKKSADNLAEEFGTIIINDGKVNATGRAFPGIGGCGTKDGNIETTGVGSSIAINGGEVTANGGTYSAGIGGYRSGFGGSVRIEGGTVTANGGDGGAGIYAADISINCQTLTATGGDDAPGIGGNNQGSTNNAGTVNINISGGTVTATGGVNAAAIGTANSMIQGGDITIKGANVTANAGAHGSGIGTGENGILNGSISFDGKVLNATGGEYGAGIGTGYKGQINGSVQIKSGTVNATAGEYAAGIGGGREYIATGELKIEGGTVTAHGGEYGAGIGGGYHGKSSDVTIKGKNTVVEAYGGKNAAGIGGGDGAVQGGKVTVEAGKVTAKGGEYGAGIGGGDWNRGNEVLIKGGEVIAKGGLNAAGIGGGNGGGGGKLRVEGGNVKADGGDSAAGIGSGEMVPVSGDELDVKDAECVVTGGRVEAYGADGAAGIGGGIGCKGINVKLLGGTTIAHSGGHGTYSAIGASKLSYELPHGDLEIADSLCVRYQIDGQSSDFAKKDGRVKACRDNYEVHVFPCEHGDKHYEEGDKEHTMICERCKITKAEPHVPRDAVKENEVSPTCTEAGSYQSVIYCRVCGHEMLRSDETVAPLGHDYETTTTEPTCVEDGALTDTCKRCDYVYTEVIPATGHAWGDWETVKEATAEEAGEQKRYCLNEGCTAEDTRVIPPGEHIHTLTAHAAEDASCTEEGNIEYWSCDGCGALFSDENGENVISASETVIPAGHKWDDGVVTKEATCTTDGTKTSTCTVCGVTSAVRIIHTGHAASTEDSDPIWDEKTITEATCVRKGLILRTLRCLHCGEILTRETKPVDKLPHSWDEGEVTTAPTADKDGVKTFTCTVCGETKTEVIPKTGPAPKPEPKPAPKPSDSSSADPVKKVGYSPFRAKIAKVTNNSIQVKWNKVSGASKYVIYGNICGVNKLYKLVTVKGNSKVFKELRGKKLKKGKYYKFTIFALDKNNKVIAESKDVHAATKGGKWGNYQRVKVSKAVIRKAKKLKKGKTLKLKAKAVRGKLPVDKHVGVRYESTNTKVATVSAKGVVKAKKKGICYVHAYAQNGVSKRIKIVVK